MPSVRVTQSPPPGIVRESTSEATPGRWWDANNIRWRGGAIVPIGGSAALTGSDVSSIPRDIVTWHDNKYQRWAAFGTDTNLYAFLFDTGTLYIITPTGAPTGSCRRATSSGFPASGAMAMASTASAKLSRWPDRTSRTARRSRPTGGRWIPSAKLLVVVPTQDGHLYVWDPKTPGTPATQVLDAPTNKWRRHRYRSAQRRVVWRRRRSTSGRVVGSGGYDGLDA